MSKQLFSELQELLTKEYEQYYINNLKEEETAIRSADKNENKNSTRNSKKRG